VADAVEVSESRAYPVSVEETFDRLLPLPLTELFASWFGPLPPIRSVDQSGVWGTAGQERTIRTADGGSMRERLVEVDRPRRFTYELTGFAGPLKPVLASVDGAWTVEPAGTGARVTWSWRLHPAGTLGGLALLPVARLWPGYARAALARLESVLLA
jgi:hypothetical protein